MLPAIITDHQDEIEALCRKFHVRRLEVFGSAATGDWDPSSSDIDFLVKFDAEASWKAEFNLAEALQGLLDRDVDLVADFEFKNPYFRRSVEASRTHLWGETRDNGASLGVAVTDHQALKYLWDIREECEYLRTVATGAAVEKVLDDPSMSRAVLHAITRVGEQLNALSRSDPDIAKRITDHRGYVNQRNIVVHRYYEINWERIWHTVTVEAPLLMDEVEMLMNELDPEECDAT